MTVSTPLTAAQVGARLDRLPVSRFHYRFLGLISLGVWFDVYDNFIANSLALLLPAAGVLREPQKGELISDLGLFMASLPLGMLLGTLFLGAASDRLGRRFGFVAMLLLYSLASLAGGAGYYPLVAVAGSGAGMILLVVTRLLAGAGIGAENVVMDTYVSEVMPAGSRGWAAAVTHALIFTAFPAAALLSFLIAPRDRPDNWWMLLVIGSLGALFSWYFRRRLPESPRWAARVGRTEEARKALEAIEAAVERETGRPLPPPAEVTEAPAKRRMLLREIWSSRYRGRTLMLIAFHLMQTAGYYGFMHWLAKLFAAKGFPEEALRMQLVSSLLAPFGPLIAVWVGERWQRKWTLAGLGFSLGAAQLTFGAVDEAWLLMGLGALVVLGCNWFSAVYHAYQAELFPTEARATGVGFTYAFSRGSMVLVSLAMPTLIHDHLGAAFAFTASGFIGAALVVGIFGPLTNNRALEELSPS